MPSRSTIPKREEIDDDTPLRLDVAAKLAYPDGSMSANGLRCEGRRGHLEIRKQAGKYYTTLRAIKEMWPKCPRADEDRDCGNAPPAGTDQDVLHTPATGSLSMDDIRKAHDAALTIVQELSEHSPPTSRASKSQALKGNVIRLKSQSRKY